MSIMRGSIRIEKNPVLCYVDTIDWSYISHSGEEHFIKGNKLENECPRKCPDKCHELPKQLLSKSTGQRLTSCWTDSDCQKRCDPKCERSGCLPNGECCDKQCLGGCTGPRSSDCVSCKGVSVNNICVGNCPSNMYKFLERRCVYDYECYDMSAPKEYQKEILHPWRPFNESCVLECPPGYSEKRISRIGASESNDTFACEKCNGPCEKECEAGYIDNIAASQRLRGCTIIKNSLEIQIRGGKNLVKELEENLQSIREINGYLKIVRSFSLVSLNFLRNLKVIHGKKLDTDKYSLVVLDNQNLQKLWDWSPNSTFAINNGKVFFHFNPKLCRQEIEALRNKTGMPEYDELEVSKTSNGDKVACDMDVLNVTVSKVSAQAVLIMWNAFRTPDPRTLLGYVVYSIEAPFRNVTLYDGRDACGGDGWSVHDVAAPDERDEFPDPSSAKAVPASTHILTYLKPYTQYAFYVRTYTVARGAQSVRGAQSKIQYFRTLPDVPSPPRDLKAFPNSSSELVIQWLPSAQPNGNVTKYIVRGIMEAEEPDRSSYCDDPLTDRPVENIADKIAKTTEAPIGDDKTGTGPEGCSCSSKDEINVKQREKETENEIQFEDQLHNMIYIRRNQDDQRRKKRTLSRFISDEAYNRYNEAFYRYKRSVGQESRFPDNAEESRTTLLVNNADFKENFTAGVFYSFQREVTASTMLVVRNLHHYARYTIKVIACREIDPMEDPTRAKNCSREAIINQRTYPLASADVIPESSIEITNSTKTFRWKPPPNPNGIIVKYDIQLHHESVDSSVPLLHCLPRGNTSFVVRGSLQPGNWSIRVSATSLFGPGNYTEKKFFIIPEPSTTNTQTMLYILLGLFFLLLVAGGLAYYARKIWCPPPVPAMKLITNINPDYHSATYVPDEWEVPRENIQIIKELGQGSFGMVYEGIIHNCPRTGIAEQPCAIKTVNEHSNDRDRIEFLNEASVMKAFKTHHVVRLLGVVSLGQPTLVVMELMARGDLKSYLRKHRPDESDDPELQPPTLKQILRMAMEIADGMAYLSAKKFVHRDLAARNCMVADDMTVKIGDFGMTRDIYETEYYRKGSKGLMPVRWMAPESLKDGVFTSSSDVWSYGVVLWEMATLASQPYQGLSNEQVLRYVKEGGVMEAPENCPEQLYNLMRRCWQFKPLHRPSFLTLVEMLLPEAETWPSFNARSFYHSPEASEIRHPPETGLAPLEEGEMDGDIEEAISPRTPLRRAVHDLEDFDVDGSESETEQADLGGMPAPAPSSYAQYHKAYSSDSSRDSKASNGSGANANPSTANGYIHDHWHRHGNGATSHTSHPPHSSHHGPPPTLKTTEC